MKLTIFATTDVHGAIYPYNYFDQQPVNHGLINLKSYIDQYKKDHPDEIVLTVDNGDLLQGDVWSDYDVAHSSAPLIAGHLNDMYDVIGLGNHEFNFGLDYLNDIYSKVDIPIINSNIDFLDNPLKDKVERHAIIPCDTPDGRLNIGFVSAVPTQIMKWDKYNLEGNVEVSSMKESIDAEVHALKENGADIVIMLSHSGMSRAKEDMERFGENQTFLMTFLKDIDGIVFGHTHELFPHDGYKIDVSTLDIVKGTVNGVPMVQPGVQASHLGRLTFEIDMADGVRITDSKAQLIVAESIELTPEYLSRYESQHNEVLRSLSTEFGEIKTAWHSYFSRVAPSYSVQAVAEAVKEYTLKIKDDIELPDLPVLPFSSAVKSGRDGAADFTVIDKGTFILSDAIDIYKHANSFMIIKVTGDILKEWLEWGASQFTSDKDENILYPNRSRAGFPGYNFDVFPDLEYTIDISQPPRYSSSAKKISDSERIVSVTYKGGEIGPDDEFIVPAHNYRVAYTPFLRNQEILHESDKSIRDIVIDYMKTEPEFELKDPITVIPSGKYYFISATKARDYIKDEPIRHIRTIDDGFSWYEIEM